MVGNCERGRKPFSSVRGQLSFSKNVCTVGYFMMCVAQTCSYRGSANVPSKRTDAVTGIIKTRFPSGTPSILTKAFRRFVSISNKIQR
jgi:hypothetical protein